MSEAHKMHEDYLGGEVRLSRSSDSSVFTTIKEKLSTGIEQLAGMIHEKSNGLKENDKTAKVAEYGQHAADALHSSANYIRQADLDQMQTDLKSTIKRHPERSLLVGLGVGILVGSILRKKG